MVKMDHKILQKETHMLETELEYLKHNGVKIDQFKKLNTNDRNDTAFRNVRPLSTITGDEIYDFRSKH